MSVLVELDLHEDANEVHVGGVKLEEDVLWTDVIATRHEALHHQSHAQSIKYTVVLRNSKLVMIKIVQFFNCFKKLSLLHTDKTDEEDAIANVANVAEDIVEGSQLAIRLETKEVIVAKVLITFGSIGSFRDDQLVSWDAVEHTENENEWPVKIRLLVHFYTLAGVTHLLG